jgi:hypothetical protein
LSISKIYTKCVSYTSFYKLSFVFINCNKITSEIFRRGCHRNLILAYFEEVFTILILEMNHMDEFVLSSFFLFWHFISWFMYDENQPWKKQDKWPWYQRCKLYLNVMQYVYYGLHHFMIYECEGAAVLLYTNKFIYQFVSNWQNLEM